MLSWHYHIDPPRRTYIAGAGRSVAGSTVERAARQSVRIGQGSCRSAAGDDGLCVRPPSGAHGPEYPADRRQAWPGTVNRIEGVAPQQPPRRRLPAVRSAPHARPRHPHPLADPRVGPASPAQLHDHPVAVGGRDGVVAARCVAHGPASLKARHRFYLARLGNSVLLDAACRNGLSQRGSERHMSVHWSPAGGYTGASTCV